MNVVISTETKEKLRQVIKKENLLFSKDGTRITAHSGGTSGWIFDLRPLLLNSESLSLLTDVFWDTFKDTYPFQVGCEEIAAIPLLGAIALRGKEIGKPVHAFVIRKSRKKTGLQKRIEGGVDDSPIILIDDTINSGNTLLRQITALEEKHSQIRAIFSLVKFRDSEYYRKLTEHGEKIMGIFTLEDFNLTSQEEAPLVNPALFSVVWKFQTGTPNHFHIAPRAASIINDSYVYFGGDDGFMRAFSQETGIEIWKFGTGKTSSNKRIFSTPALYKNSLFFGSYDGNVYSLDRETGKLLWRFDEADWVGSSPTVSEKLGLVFIGLEFGLFSKKGGVVALDVKTGEKKWEYILPKEYVHASPLYIPEKNWIAIGSNDKHFYVLNAKDGTLIWSFEAGGEIKSRAAFHKNTNAIIFGSFDGHLYILDAESGSLKGKLKTENVIYSTPLIEKNLIYFTSGDKKIYCADLSSGDILWEFETLGRVMSDPRIVGDKLYIGSNDGRLYEFDKKNGRLNGFFQTTERITNAPAVNEKTGHYFVTTTGGELFCLKRKGE